MARVLVYGSSFDPPTYGHFVIANMAAARQKFDEVILVVASKNRIDKQLHLSDQHRYQMTKLAVEEHNHNGKQFGKHFIPFSVSNVELNNSIGLQNTYETMKYFKESRPDDEFVFLLGADILENIVSMDYTKRWTKGKELIAENQFIIMNRDEYNTARIIAKNPILRQHENHFTIMDKGFAMEISSTYIRDEIEMNGNPRHLLPDVCYQYIIEHKLYGYKKEEKNE